MKIAISDIRRIVRESIKLYHGSPYRGIKKFSDFRGRIPYIFFTPHRGTAIEYSRTVSHVDTTFSRKDPGGERASGPTLYSVRLDFSDADVFDTGRNPEHAEIYKKIQDDLWKLDDEDFPSKLIWTPILPGSSSRVELPNWTEIRKIFPEIAKLGFRAIWFSEGPQGASLAIRLEDAGSVHIEEVEEFDDGS
jgi:hypothetical protein